MPRRFPSRTSSTDRAVEMCWMWTPTAGDLGQADVARDHDVLGRRRHAGESQPHRLEPFMHHAADGQLGDLAMLHDHPVEHLGVFEGPTHQVGRGDRRPIIGERDRPAGDQLAEFRQLFALASLADGPDRKDVRLPGSLSLEHDELGGGLGVDRGQGVGHAGDGGHPAGQGGTGAGGDGLILLIPGLAEMDVDVDQAGTDDHPPGVDHDLGLLRAAAHRQDSPPADPEVADLVEPLTRVDDPPAGDLDRRQREPPRRGRPVGAWVSTRSDDSSRTRCLARPA